MRARLFASFAVALVCSSLPAWSAEDQAPAEKLQTLPGFKIELLLKADPKVNGSWISLAKDNKGRLLLGGQNGQPITRVTLGPDGQVAKQEQLKLPISEAMGMLWAFDSLYIDGADKKGHFGLFRARDPQDNGEFGSVEMLREWRGGNGEHGTHGIVLGPDKKLYIVSGNFIEIPSDLEPTSPHKNYADDLALPRAEDGNGFGAGKKPPGGSIIRMDQDGKHAEFFAGGERNTYDIAFNTDGELFGFDSDMEWDWGTPWYRPIRVFHAPSGADQGFREGTAKWPEYYIDSLPAAVTVGIGCPTGIMFGTGAKFPAKYQKALYILDWTYGRIIATHLKPNGATYGGTWEDFIAPKGMHEKHAATPNNVTDIVIGDDGTFYFSTGGRNTQAYLYRVTYAGDESTAAAPPHEADGAEAREQRHKLEALQGKADPGTVAAAWPALSSPDRFIRYAARIAIESQPVDEWKKQAVAEEKPEGAFTALLALARMGTKEDQPALYATLAKFPSSSLSPAQQLEKLRVIEVSIARHGKPALDSVQGLVSDLDQQYPSKSDSAQRIFLDRELAQVLLALDAPGAVAKTVKLLETAPTQEEQLNYVLALRTIKTGWTPELRRSYFAWWTRDHAKAQHPDYVLKWYEDAGRDYSDGASYPNFVKNLHEDAKKSVPPDDMAAVAEVVDAYTPTGSKPKPTLKPRAMVKEWAMTDFEPQLAKVGKGRSFNKGRTAFEAAQCLACHRFGNEGGAVGPDLTAVSARFARRDILESIIEPSKVISEQYADTIFKLKNNDVVSGRIVEENDAKVVVRPNPLQPQTVVTLNKADIKQRVLSKVSPMPTGLVNTLTADEVLDLLAYLESSGHKDHPDFAKQ